MQDHWLWWFAALLLVIAEMFTGTFYLLAIAAGFLGAGLVAYLGLAWSGQVVVASLLCSACVLLIQRWKKQQVDVHGTANFSNDIGEFVHVVTWLDERHARVSYRGAEWDAELASYVLQDIERSSWRIVDIVGSHLIVE